MTRFSPNPFIASTDRPLVLGHRGVPLLAQENTLFSLRKAAELGLDGVEIDVQLTKDGKVVLFHDEDTERLTGEPGRVTEMTWDELSRRRIRSTLTMGLDPRGEPVTIEYDQEQPIPLLEEVLDELTGELAINIELKPPLPSWRQRHVGREVAKLIRQADAGDSCVVTSFDFFKLQSLEREHEPIHSGFVYDDHMADLLPRWLARLPDLPIEISHQEGAAANAKALINVILEANTIGRWIGSTVVDLEHSLIDSDTITKFHARGMGVGTYTLLPLAGDYPPPPLDAQERELLELAALKVDWIETDDPVRTLQILG